MQREYWLNSAVKFFHGRRIARRIERISGNTPNTRHVQTIDSPFSSAWPEATATTHGALVGPRQSCAETGGTGGDGYSLRVRLRPFCQKGSERSRRREWKGALKPGGGRSTGSVKNKRRRATKGATAFLVVWGRLPSRWLFNRGLAWCRPS